MAGGKGKQFGKQNLFNLKLNGLKLTAKPEGEGQKLVITASRSRKRSIADGYHLGALKAKWKEQQYSGDRGGHHRQHRRLHQIETKF
jgi:hypothetical protein